MKKCIILFLALSLAKTCFSCSAFKFVQDNQVMVGKNFDWFTGEGVLLINNRNQQKCTYLKYHGNNTCWTSKYGSITFNQNGKELPYGGMNEEGLVVEMLWLKETNYPAITSSASTISELEWIQYQLDNYKNVDEVLSNIASLHIDPFTATIHYFIVDKNGKSAVIDFLGGETVIHVSDDEVQSISNGSFTFNQSFYNKNKEALGDKYVPKKMASPLRYCSVQNNLEKWNDNKKFGLNSATETLALVAENKEIYKSYWTIFYDISQAKITFHTFDNNTQKTIAIQDLNFESNKSMFYDLASLDTKQEIINQLAPYSLTKNASLIEACISPKLVLDTAQLNQHQLNPIRSYSDLIFEENHMDVEVSIETEEQTGQVQFYLADSEINYRRQGPYGAPVIITGNKTTHWLYSLPRGQYAYGAMHDVNNNGYLDRNFIKFPKEPFAFSGKKRFLFFPPKFSKACFELTEKITIQMN